MNKCKIIFIAGALSQPRIIKRITAFYDQGYETVVYGYDRGKYDVNTYPEGITVNKLGNLKDGADYINKFVRLYSDIKRIVKEYRDESVCFYAFGYVEALLLCWHRVNYIYEISDIFYAYPKYKVLFPLLKYIDKKLIRRSYKTIMTSNGFYDFFSLANRNIIVLPNKVSNRMRLMCERKSTHLDENKYNFAFVGAVRYTSILRFAEVIGKFYPQHKFSFYGGCSEDVKGLIKGLQSKYSNIAYFGPYRNPDDLPSIYSEIDIVVACYDVNSLNERIAEPNKLYESLFFCKPIIVSDKIYLSQRVNELGCGFAIDASSEDSIKRFIDTSLTIEKINSISEKELSMPADEYVDNTEKVVSTLFR